MRSLSWNVFWFKNVFVNWNSKSNTGVHSILPGRKLLGEEWRSVIREDVWRMLSSLSRSSLRFWRSFASSRGAKAVSTRFLTSLVVHSFVGRSDNLWVGWLEEDPFTPSCRDDNVVGVSCADPINIQKYMKSELCNKVLWL